jgi:serine/threonine-protein kinase
LKIAHYQVTAKLGRGGMGDRYRATDTKLDREVAIKVLPESCAQDTSRLARFEREAKLLASLNHLNIVGIHRLEDEGDTHALVLELVEGEDLSGRLKRGALPLEEVHVYAEDPCESVESNERGTPTAPTATAFTAVGSPRSQARPVWSDMVGIESAVTHQSLRNIT